MESGTTGNTAATGTLEGGAVEPAKRERKPTTYAVYRAAADDVNKDRIASQLNLIAQGIVAKSELEARWAVIDGDEALTAEVKEHAVDLVAIPEVRIAMKRTRLERKVAERRV